ncbi:MAG: hypothetical protein CMN33_00345 [Saprospirales bacterium]|nr:hypothetical protein [Saprospirales bacterium]
MSMINTIIADCQILMIEGLTAIFDSTSNPSIKVSASANNSADLLKKVSLGDCDLLIMDINFPGEDGIELIPILKSYCPNMRVIVLTTYTDRKFVKRAFLNGTDGYILKSNDSLDLFQGINAVMEGDTYMSDGLRVTPASSRTYVTQAVANLANRFYEDSYTMKQKLTKREQEILHLIAESKNNREIAKDLYISDQTVGVHRKNIMRKLGVRSTVNLIKFAIEHQLV